MRTAAFGPKGVRSEWATEEARQDLARLSEPLRLAALRRLVQAQQSVEPAEECRDAPGQPLDACVKIRFGEGDGAPRYRIVAEYLPTKRPDRLLVWAAGLGHPTAAERTPSAYALAGSRRAQRLLRDANYQKEAGR